MELCINPVTSEFKHLTTFWMFNRDEVKCAVAFCGLLLGNCSEEHRNDKEIALIAVSENGDALQFVLGPLREQEDVIARAIKRTPKAIRHTSFEHMQRYPSMFMDAMKSFGTTMLNTDESLVKHLDEDRYMAAIVVRANGELLQHLSAKYKNDVIICEIAIRSNYRACKHVEIPIEMCEDVAVEVLRGHAYSIFKELPKSWRGYEPLFRVLLPECNEVYIHTSNELKEKYTLLALTIHGNRISSGLPMHMRCDEEWVIDMLRTLADEEANCHDPSFQHLWRPSRKQFWKHIDRDLHKRKEELMFAAYSNNMKGSPMHNDE